MIDMYTVQRKSISKKFLLFMFFFFCFNVFDLVIVHAISDVLQYSCLMPIDNG